MRWTRSLWICAIAAWMALFLPAAAYGYTTNFDTNVYNNEYIITERTPKGHVGKNMTITFKVQAKSGEMKDVYVGLSDEIDNDFTYWEERDNASDSVNFYPFEVNRDTFVRKSIGSIRNGGSKTVSFSVKVRYDITQGYYSIPIHLEWDGGDETEKINVWISTDATDTKDDDGKEQEGTYFVLGENQETPRGVYPNVLNYSLNVRNKGQITAQDVTIRMNLSEKPEEFPFAINDGNYDRYYERVGSGETVAVPYSFAIRPDSYTGYYPIKFTITFRLSSQGDIHTEEMVFFVHVTSKEKDDDLGEFNVNDRTKARLVVESFETNPKEIYAGDEFELVLNMKNASTSVPASNILFTLESEKVSDSAVFTTESGSSSVVVNSLAAGATTQLKMKFTARAGVDQRSYSITIKEKYDSPEFKNAEESVSVDIPVKQYARFSTSTIEVMPESIAVGSETNVMFGINNTGKVQLYNVTVKFEGETIKTADTYVGNIKPGETGNVDAMITGEAPTMDEGYVGITITYEDENGVVTTDTRQMQLFVTEAQDDMMFENMDVMAEGMDQEGEKSFFAKYQGMLIAAAVIGTAAALIGVRVYKKRKTRREEEEEDEISGSDGHEL